jgi:hypothetical protein
MAVQHDRRRGNCRKSVVLGNTSRRRRKKWRPYIKVNNIGPTLIPLWKVEVSEMKTGGKDECGN